MLYKKNKTDNILFANYNPFFVKCKAKKIGY